MKKYILSLFTLLFATVGFVMSQNQSVQDINISLPYLCGFEDTLEVAKWKINAGPDGPNCREYWEWGNRECSEGFNSLYVLCDTSLLSEIRAERVKPQLAISYRPFIIPSSFNPAKSYYNVDVSFEWKGSLDSREEGPYGSLNIYILPEDYISEADLVSSSISSDLPRKLNNQNLSLGYFSGALDWKTELSSRTTRIDVDKKYFLIFVWRSINAWEKYCIPEATWIDNIQITSSDSRRPKDLKVEEGLCDTLKASWSGEGIEYFHFEYRPAGAAKWRGKTITKDNHVVISDLKEGGYNVRVRGITGKDTSAWVTYNDAIIYCPDRHCINFVQLDRPGVTCEIGEASDPTRGRPHIEPTLVGEYNAGPIDFGSNDKRSRHTVHWKQNEFDPRIGGRSLRTVPEGALASVRLGNWEAGARAEGILFDYFVDTAEASILLLRYAVVLEAPGHGITMDPYFKLEILGEDGKPIGGRCGEFDFSPTNEDIKWNRGTAAGDGGTTKSYVWKDWSSVGVNLVPYHGQTIQLHLITQDCLANIHFGYAYFTLECSHAEITTESCGDLPYMEMKAPEGFRYIWTRDDDREKVVSTDQILQVPITDTHTYYCNAEYIDVKGCGFELHSSVFKREPVADFDYTIDLTECNCENKVVLTNRSCVYNKFADSDSLIKTDEPCENFYWILNDGEVEDATEKLTYIAPKEGGELKVTLLADIADGKCQDDTTFIINVPPIYKDPDTLYNTLCKGETVVFAGKVLGRDTVATEILKNQYGCDSVTVLDLSFWPLPDDTYIYDTICDNEIYFFDGKSISKSGEYSAFLQTVNGCDSSVFLNLEVVPSMGISIPNDYEVACADDKKLYFEYQTMEGKPKPTKYSILFDTLANQYGFVDLHNLDFDSIDSAIPFSLPEPCRPNHYTATIVIHDESSVCGDISIPVSFDIWYSSSIMQPKFDNLITILSADSNGGYHFKDGEYKWYVNNELDSAVTSPFYFLPGDETFGADCYYLELTRLDDGVVMRTCEICPGRTPIVDVFEGNDFLPITLFDKSQPIIIDGVTAGKINIFTLTGLLLHSVEIESDYTEILAPYDSGIYLLQIQTEKFSGVYKIKVK